MSSMRLLLCLITALSCIGGNQVSAQDTGDNHWVLAGTLLAGEQSRAIFRSDVRAERMVAVHDMVGDCEVTAILRNNVHMSCSDRQEKMKLSYGMSLAVLSRAETSAAQQNGESIVLQRSAIASLFKDPQQLVSQISVEPRVIDDVLQCYEITHLKQDGELHRLGLQQGDLITAVNGVPASQAHQFMQVLNNFSELASIELQLTRARRPQLLSYIIH